MKILFNLTILFSSVYFTSCGPTYRPFTAELQEQNRWTEDELKHIQFYLSNDIVLRRNLSRGESVIEGGKIRIKEGQRIEEVVIKEGTPGVLVFMPKEERLAIAFESGKGAFSGSKGNYIIIGAGIIAKFSPNLIPLNHAKQLSIKGGVRHDQGVAVHAKGGQFYAFGTVDQGNGVAKGLIS